MRGGKYCHRRLCIHMPIICQHPVLHLESLRKSVGEGWAPTYRPDIAPRDECNKSVRTTTGFPYRRGTLQADRKQERSLPERELRQRYRRVWRASARYDAVRFLHLILHPVCESKVLNLRFCNSGDGGRARRSRAIADLQSRAIDQLLGGNLYPEPVTLPRVECQ